MTYLASIDVMAFVVPALQFGFHEVASERDGDTHYHCTESQLIAFAKACVRAGREEAIAVANEQSSQYDRVNCCQESALAGECDQIADTLTKMNAASDAELAPILEAERQKRILATHAPILEGRHEDCAKPYDSRAAHVCVCHARMGNDFYFMPAGSCLEKSK